MALTEENKQEIKDMTSAIREFIDRIDKDVDSGHLGLTTDELAAIAIDQKAAELVAMVSLHIG